MPQTKDRLRRVRRKTVRVLARVSALASVLVIASSAKAFSQPSEYVVGPNDVLAVTVLNQPTLSGKFTVVADGTVSYPLLGPVKVAGLSLEALERDLTAKLADGYLKKPVVSVTVEQARSQFVFVTGEVRQAGTYPLLGRTTALEVLLKAGVLTQTAGTEVLITRDPAAGGLAADGAVLRVSLEALQKGDPAQNVLLHPGDHIFVPRAELPIPVYVMGLVKTPGFYQLAKGATVLQALAQAGGVTDRGSTRRVKIVRKVDGKNAEIDGTLEDVVQAGDTIVVKRRFF
jgi:polysaccharide export outer membrane protein